MLLARPDLAAPVEHVIFEVKSIDDADESYVKMDLYLGLLSYLDPVRGWDAGQPYQYTPKPKIDVLGYPVIVFPPSFCVIVYYVNPLSQKAIYTAIASVATLGAASLSFDIGISFGLAFL
jgi:hypothetical protein